MTDTNQLPQSEREAFEAFAQNCPMGKYSIARRGDGYDSSHTQLMWDAWQARAQVQGEPFAWVEHHKGGDNLVWDEPGGRKSPLYTAPQPAQATQAEVTEGQRKTVDQIMEQAQVFASAWALVGGRFDSGDALDDAHEAKEELREIVSRAILALRPERVPMTDEQRQSAFLSAPTSSGGHRTAFMLGIQFAEAHHDITAQAKKEAT